MKTNSMFCITFWLIAFGTAMGQPAYEGYFLKINSYPEDATHDWNHNYIETQGVTHDETNWYFTSTFTEIRNARIWRIPLSIALDQDVRGKVGVRVDSMSNIPELAAEHYWHWGDPDHFRSPNGTDYILVPVTSDLPGNGPAIALFRASDLYFMDYAPLIGPAPPLSTQASVGWCAVSDDGDLFTSNDDDYQLWRYDIDWEQVDLSGNLSIEWLEWIHLFDENGGFLGYLHNMQGGEFSPSGELLYVSCGSGECYYGDIIGGGHGVYPTDGIHVFGTSTWRRVKRSTNTVRDETGTFNYEFDNSCTCVGLFSAGSQTPEGLTIWDLSDGRAQMVQGQLHVLINFYNPQATCDDALSLQHFGNNIVADNATPAPPPIEDYDWSYPLYGTSARPFNNFFNAMNWYPTWDGAEIAIKAGSYPETGIFSRRVKISAQGGTVIIGN